MTDATQLEEPVPDLEISNLVKRFGSVTAVNDVTFTVAPGEILALLGPSE